MKTNRSWLSLLFYCFTTAVAAALVFAVIVAGGSVALASHQVSEESPPSQDNQNEGPAGPPRQAQATFSGMITDSYCGARHMRHSNLTPAECASLCIRSSAGYILVDGDRRYKLTGANEALKKLLGTRARVSGTREGNTITVSAAGPLSE